MTKNNFLMSCQLIFYGFTLLLLTGCSKSSNQKVGMLLHQLDGRWTMDTELLEKGFKAKGIEFVLKVANGNENLQLQQTEELINEGVDIILIVAANQNTAAASVRSANEKGIPIIGYDRMIKNCNLDYYLSFDYEQIGRLIADYAIKKVPKGNYVLFWGDAFDDNARAMQRAQLEILKPSIENGSINIVYKTFIDSWNNVNAKKMMDKIVDFATENIDVVMASNDKMANGVIQSLEENNLLNNIMVTGHDATVTGRKLLEEGKLAMTVYKPINELADNAVNLVVDLLNGNSVEINSTIFNGRKNVAALLLPAQTMDQSNQYPFD